MVQLIAMVKPFRAQAVLEALQGVPIVGGSVREAMGFGRQKDRLHHYLGSEYNAAFLPKVEIRLFLEEGDVEAAVRAIVSLVATVARSMR